MKQSLEILKSYFETGDKPTQSQYEDIFDSMVHRDEIETITNTVFVSAVKGNDITAKIGDPRKPYLTIDAAITAFEAESPREGDLTSLDHTFLNITLISEGTYEINGQLPQRNINLESKKVCTIDFSNNTNEYFNVFVAGVYHKYKFSLPKGRLLNNSENIFIGAYLFIEGEFDILESYGASYSAFGKGLFFVNQVNVTYNLLKGNGIVFSTLSTTAENYFKGNIESIGGKLVVNNEGKGINHFDFDEVTGTHEVTLLKGSLVGLTYVNFGKFNPNVVSEIVKIAHTGKIYVTFKENAETYGSFSAGETHFTGHKVIVNAALTRLQYKLFFEDIFIKSSRSICSLIGGNAQIFIKNSHIEIPADLVYIETNTNFTGDTLVFQGRNTIHQTTTPGYNLITKYTTANPTNFSAKIELQNSLITNGVLNTTITGNTNSTASVAIETTNTY